MVAARLAWIACFCIFAAACTSPQYRQISANGFVDHGDTPLSHTVYLGSDEGFHYFAWTAGKQGGRWKVRKDEMPFDSEFPLGSREAFVYRASDGSWQPYLGSERDDGAWHAGAPDARLRPAQLNARAFGQVGSLRIGSRA